MDDRSVCTPLLAESDTHHNTTSTPNAASVTDADKVINTQIDSTQVEGDEEERLEGLLADDYCHVCEAVLLFESQRLSHYEGKKHAQKLKVYVQAKRAEEDMDKESARLQRTMTADKDHFCELCTMVFSSHVVAKSHYEGKVHAKNLRKQGLQPPGAYTEARTLPRLVRGPDDADQNSPPDPTGDAAAPSAEVDLKDPNKHCALCAAAFNNPQMALQHYNGRKHQRNQARRDLLKELGDDVQQANSLMCQMCSVQFNSVEMYQAHMQGNKHQIREKKVVKLCKSQQKDYNTFADELADYIQVQKARGIAPKAAHVPPLGDARQEGEEDEKEEEAFNQGDGIDLNQRMPSVPPTSHPPHHSRPGGYYPAVGWRPPHQGPPWPSHHLDYSRPPPVSSGFPLFTNPHTNRKRCRKQLSSSSGTTSSSPSSSSFSSSTSDSDDGSEYRRRGKRRTRRSRRPRDEDSDKEEKRMKRRRREGADDSEERRREESGGSEKEGARKKRKNHGKQRRREHKSREEDFEVEGVERVTDNVMPEMPDDRKEPEVRVQAEMSVEQEEGEDETSKPKYRKEKKKTKEKADTRTEEEKLWDDSILGC
ncbi:zinc finger matrin-type protein 1 [Clinocottus analis]|uniref:zinc finger matrin-type protein 1 n=1 Tax=Clinocottus analis TaxID=304258 RepID=UPI0035BF399D